MNGQDDIRGGLNAAVAATLNGERTAAHLTIEDLAARSGVKARTLKRLLRSQRDIDVNVMAQIGAVFNLTPAEVVARAEDWQRRNQPEDEAADMQETARQIVAEARQTARGVKPPPDQGKADTVRPAKRGRSGSA